MTISTCEVCDQTYEAHTETAEIKESGMSICPECWNNEE
jgi:ribosome-binding protein aMBF1 (putative translation factor)